MKKDYPPPEWLKYQTTFNQAESDRDREAADLNAKVSPHWLARWEKFKSEYSDGDQLWYFEYFPGTLTGGAGYCIKRNGETIAWIATKRS
jgi:hypothetical protein